MKRMTIRRKMMVTNILLFLCPILLMFAIVFMIVLQKSNLDVNHTKLDSLQQQSEQLINMNNEIVTITNAILLDPMVNRVLSKKGLDSDYEYLKDSEVVSDKIVSTTTVFDSKRFRIMIESLNGYSYYSDLTNELSLDELRDELWYEDLLKSNGEVFYLSLYESEILSERFEPGSLFVFRMIPNLNSGRNVAVMMIELTPDVLMDVVLQSDGRERNYLIVDGLGKVICSSNPSIYGVDLSSSSYYTKISNNEKGFFLGKVNRIKSQIFFVTWETIGYKILSYHTFVPEWDGIVIVILVVAAICILLTLLMSQYNAVFVFKRIKKINANILEITGGNLQTRITGEYELEFHILCESFNEMLDYIQALMEQLEQEEKRKNYLEIQALQAQINPHFLYNTLATIRFMLQMGEYERADRAMIAFSKLLRNSFSDQRRIVTIREELELVNQYLIIMSMRYQDSFEWEFDIPSDIQNYGILRQVVQPLVENSISHGFNTKQQKGHVKISGQNKENEIRLIIEDDGENADMSKIQCLLNSEEIIKGSQEQLSGIGLSNVQLRLKKNFGFSFGLTVERNILGGVTFMIRLPKVTGEDIV